MAYTRNPACLFANPGPFLPPMNFVNAESPGSQPVMYQNVILQGTTYPAVQVDWLEGHIHLFESLEEAINGIPLKTIPYFCLATCPEASEHYVVETLGFLHRGHSLLHPHCTCQHDLTLQRCQTLGITHDTLGPNPRRGQRCPLPQVSTEISAADLSLELAVQDVQTMVCGQVPLVHFLEKHCQIRIDQEKGLFFSRLDTVHGPLRSPFEFPPPIYCAFSLTALARCKEDLLRKLESHPLPFEVSLLYPPNYYGLAHDIQELEREGLVYVISRQENSAVIYNFKPGPKVDDDIKALWHQCGGQPLKEDMARLSGTKRPYPAD